MNRRNSNILINCLVHGEPLVLVDDEDSFRLDMDAIMADIYAGFLVEIDPSYRLKISHSSHSPPLDEITKYRNINELSLSYENPLTYTIVQRRFVPTEIGMEFLRFKML